MQRYRRITISYKFVERTHRNETHTSLTINQYASTDSTTKPIEFHTYGGDCFPDAPTFLSKKRTTTVDIQVLALQTRFWLTVAVKLRLKTRSSRSSRLHKILTLKHQRPGSTIRVTFWPLTSPDLIESDMTSHRLKEEKTRHPGSWFKFLCTYVSPMANT